MLNQEYLSLMRSYYTASSAAVAPVVKQIQSQQHREVTRRLTVFTSCMASALAPILTKPPQMEGAEASAEALRQR